MVAVFGSPKKLGSIGADVEEVALVLDRDEARFAPLSLATTSLRRTAFAIASFTIVA
jgi:hypothetical protein